MHESTRLETAVEGRTWIFPVLTLDVIRPFYEMMGLRPGDPDLFQKTLRDATLATRKQLERAVVAGKVPPTLADFCQYVEGAIGPSATEHFIWWLQNIYHDDPRTNLELDDWVYVFRYSRHESDRWLRLELPKERSDEVLNRFRLAIDVKEFNRREEELKARPLSDWDLHLYASQLYDYSDDLEGPGGNPFTDVVATIRDYQGYLFWAWMRRTLSYEQLTQLREAALGIVRDEELTSVKDLVHPSTLDIGL